MPKNTSNTKQQRTPLGGGKRSRKQQCKLAAQSRWKSTKSDVEQPSSLDQVGVALTEPVLRVEGAAERSCDNNDAGNQRRSTAREKLALMNEYGGDNIQCQTDSKDRCFVELASLQKLFSSVACSVCNGSVTVQYGDKMGFSREIRLACEDCQFTAQQYSCARMDGSDDVTKGFDINQSMVLCFNELGCGEAALRKFSAITAIPGLAHNTYRRLSKKVGVAHTEVTANVLTAAVRAVSDAYTRDGADVSDDGDARDDGGSSDGDSIRGDGDADAVGGDDGDSIRGDGDADAVGGDESDGASSNSDDSDSDGDDNNHGAVVDVTVSFDGTWHKRGFTSNYGVGIVIDVMTGLVLDYEVLSKYCHACTVNEKAMLTEIERAEWTREHAPVCEKNYTGSSKGMEKEAAVRMWRRSIEKNGMRYINMLSDGDSVAYKAVCDENIYNVKKLECVNHCDKRMGTALRKKAKEAKLGGRRRGALTAGACNILQSYYRNAIMQNLGDPAQMKEAILASFLHCTSSDDSPQHMNCPQGPQSWCFYNKAIANGQQPPPHKENVGTPLSGDVARAIRPIYERMSELSLLNRIQHGRTQNANECVNGQIWARCPKTVHVGASRVNAAVASAVSHFNQGCSHLSQVMTKLGSAPSSNLQQYQATQDLKRCSQADDDCAPAKKRARKANKCEKKRATRTQEKGEGQTYGPGML